MSGSVQITTEGRVRQITLDNPAKKNAITPAMNRALADALAQADADPQIRCVVLTGAGGNFTSGADVDAFLKVARGESAYEAPSPFVKALFAFEKPVLAAVEGLAIGVGTTLLLHCDLVFAAPDARLRMSFVDLGLTPEAGSSLLLPLLVGHQKASAWLLLAKTISASEAQAAGLVTEVTPSPLAAALTAARVIAEKPPASVRATKALLRRGRATAEALAAEAEIFGARLRSPEAEEAFSAILEKRKADFSRFG